MFNTPDRLTALVAASSLEHCVKILARLPLDSETGAAREYLSSMAAVIAHNHDIPHDEVMGRTKVVEEQFKAYWESNRP